MSAQSNCESLTETLQPFCDENGSSRLGKPFVQSNRMYATDGRVAVCANFVAADTPQPDGPLPFPRVDKVMAWEVKCETVWTYNDLSCSECQGAGFTRSTKCHECDGDGDCEECSGAGDVRCHCCENYSTCDSCCGSGVCVECGGNGETDAREWECEECSRLCIAIGPDKRMGYSVARKINLLPNVRFGFVHDGMIAFESSNGIRGVAMLLADS